MKFTHLILTLITISNFGFSQNEISNDSLIEWNKDNELQWSNFKGKSREDAVNVVAETQCYVKITDSYYDNNGIPKFFLKCFFSENESWTIVHDLETLKHEQLHFDLWELISRKIRKKFSDLNDKSEQKVSIYHEKYYENDKVWFGITKSI